MLLSFPLLLNGSGPQDAMALIQQQVRDDHVLIVRLHKSQLAHNQSTCASIIRKRALYQTTCPAV